MIDDAIRRPFIRPAEEMITSSNHAEMKGQDEER
jgi:hypothetical protein